MKIPVIAFLMALQAAAQIGGAAISGDVRDPHGSVIPGATVVIARSGDTQARSVRTSASGTFAVPDLPPGDYTVTVSIPGFKTWRSTVSLRAGEPVIQNARLEIGSLSESILVNRPGPMAGEKVTAPQNAQTADEYFELARWHYTFERFAEAEIALERGVELLRAEGRLRAEGAERPVPPSAAGGPIRVGGSIEEPRKLRHVSPIYPSQAASLSVGGVVVIEGVITQSGLVRDARVIRGVPMLDEAALGAVRQWLYKPTMLNGQPIDVLVTVAVTFVAG